MFTARPFSLSLAALLAALLVAHALAAPDALTRTRRQLADDNTLQPLDDAASDDQAREKRKLEGITEAKFGIKNAVLGFVFGKINSLIDSKTRLVESLDRKNIELNKQYGIEAPKGGGLSSLSGIVGQVIGPKLQLLGPKIQAVTGLLGGASGGLSGGSGGSEWRYVEAPGIHGEHVAHSGSLTVVEPTTQVAGYPGFEYTVRPSVGYTEQPEVFGYSQHEGAQDSSPSAGALSSRVQRQATVKPTDDIPVFDRNKVSLDFPGSLFGPSVSLLIRTTKIIGDVIQNSAVRYQSFLRLFRPLFRGPFEIKGLDPPTTTTTRKPTTTTTTTTSTAAPATSDNEINRRR